MKSMTKTSLLSIIIASVSALHAMTDVDSSPRAEIGRGSPPNSRAVLIARGAVGDGAGISRDEVTVADFLGCLNKFKEKAIGHVRAGKTAREAVVAENYWGNAKEYADEIAFKMFDFLTTGIKNKEDDEAMKTLGQSFIKAFFGVEKPQFFVSTPHINALKEIFKESQKIKASSHSE